MQNILFILFILFTFSKLNAEQSFSFYLNKALENNLQLKAERKKRDRQKFIFNFVEKLLD